MKSTIKILLLSLISTIAAAQIDSVSTFHQELENAETAEDKIDLLNKLSYEYTQISLVRADAFATEALEKATEKNYQKGIATSYNNLGISNCIRGDYSAGLNYFIMALRIREDMKDMVGVSSTLNNIARVFHYQGDFKKAIEYSDRAIEILQKVDEPMVLAQTHMALGEILLSKHDNAGALARFQESREIFLRKGEKNHEGWSLLKIAIVYEADKQYEEALQACMDAGSRIDSTKDLFTTIELYQTIGSIYAKMGNKTAAYKNLYTALQLADQGSDSNGSISSRLKLANMFRQFGKYDSALHFMDSYIMHNTKAFNAEKSKQVNALEQLYQSEMKDRMLATKNERIKTQSTIISIIGLLLIASGTLGFVLFRYYKEKKRSALNFQRLNKEIYEKHEEILAQAEELTQANEEIKRMNESLEAEVMLRANKIEQQNKKLLDYAYFNAHSVRGPLARILGLTMLMEREEAIPQIKEYNGYLILAAQELDNVIKDINSKLEFETS